ncbi:VOC family protein [Flavisphingomonas formosensis]|uniref:VOC family protein n=1 Tax=Flavisphingomonas formosensis TaxID=861534 RepID=UPI0018DFBEA0|nr:VOC family protein [Sphingomonas formosensis]
MTVSLAYRGLLVSNPAASAHFYAGLGFHAVPDVGALRSDSPDSILMRNGHRVMLRLSRDPEPDNRNLRQRRPMTALGLTHLNFYVRDFDATLDRVCDRGGAVARETLIANSSAGRDMAMIYCTDPDGIRVEIWSTVPYGTDGFSSGIPGIDHKFSHSGICVRDLEESISFYEALGFRRAEIFDYRDPPGQLDRMFEEVDSSAIAQMMRNGDDVVELLSFLHPKPRQDPAWDGSASGGFNLLAFRVDSLEEAAGAEFGPRRRGYVEGFDPNGVRLNYFLPDPTA